MTADAFVVAAPLSLVALLILLSAVIVLRKLHRGASAPRRAESVARVRPAVMHLVDDDTARPADAKPAQHGDGQAAETLARSLLPELRGGSRDRVVALLDELGAVDAALRRLRRPGHAGRARAADFLGATQEPRVLAPLARLLRDRHPEVRLAAARALGALGSADATPFLLAALAEHRSPPAETVRMALRDIGEPVAARLIEGLRSPVTLARWVSADVLGALKAVDAGEALARTVANDPSDDVQAAAAIALAEVGGPGQVPTLAATLAGGGVESVRAASARALGRIGTPEALIRLQGHVADPSQQVAREVCMSLAGAGAAGRAALGLAVVGEPRAAAYAAEAITLQNLAASTHRPPARRRPGRAA